MALLEDLVQCPRPTCSSQPSVIPKAPGMHTVHAHMYTHMYTGKRLKHVALSYCSLEKHVLFLLFMFCIYFIFFCFEAATSCIAQPALNFQSFYPDSQVVGLQISATEPGLHGKFNINLQLKI